MGEDLSRIEKWFAKNQDKAMALIEKHIDSKNEEVTFFATATCYPPDILTWIPIVGNIIEASKKNYLLAVTKNRFLIIRIKKFRIEEISYQEIPISSVSYTDVTKHPLFCNLTVNTSDGKNYVFKEMLFEWAAGIKDAIDEAQGRPSTFD